MKDAVKTKLAGTVVDVLVNYGLPALVEFVGNLNDKDAVTEEDIETLYGNLDSASYFPDLEPK